MQIRNALIVYKKSAYEAYYREYRHPAITQLARAGDPGLAHLKRSHRVHYRTLCGVEAALKKKGVRCRRRFRGGTFDESAYDLVVSVGGDGTFLDAARNIRKKPLFGINSDSDHSVGRFCAADQTDFEQAFQAFFSGRFRRVKINRMRVQVGAKTVADPVLNDVLICHASPGAMSHYVLELRGRRERQRSSGVWISTAAGSTGAVGSAGGHALPLESSPLQYMPRELYEGHGARYRFRGGILPGGRILVRSQMEAGRVYMDGAHHFLRLGYGDAVRISPSTFPLEAVFFSRTSRH